MDSISYTVISKTETGVEFKISNEFSLIINHIDSDDVRLEHNEHLEINNVDQIIEGLVDIRNIMSSDRITLTYEK